MTQLTFSIPNEACMLELGGKLAKHCTPPLSIDLYGQLGAGKTTFVRGFLRGLGYMGKVKSPSYNLVETYEFAIATIYHFDFYRIQDPRELDFIGIQDYWRTMSIFLIEWPQKAGQLLPPADLACSFDFADHGRKLQIEAKSQKAEKLTQDFLR